MPENVISIFNKESIQVYPKNTLEQEIQILRQENKKLKEENKRQSQMLLKLKSIAVKISDVHIMEFLEQNPELLKNFDVIVHSESTDKAPKKIITFKGEYIEPFISEGLNRIRVALISKYGKADIDWKLISRGILLYWHIHHGSVQSDETEVLNFADSSTRKYINAPYIKKSLEHLNLDSKQIVKILLNSGKWDFKLFKASNQKQFFKIESKNKET